MHLATVPIVLKPGEGPGGLDCYGPDLPPGMVWVQASSNLKDQGWVTVFLPTATVADVAKIEAKGKVLKLGERAEGLALIASKGRWNDVYLSRVQEIEIL